MTTPAPTQSRQVSPLSLALAGSFAGLVSKATLAPLERLKMLGQSGNHNHVLVAARQVYEVEGIRGFWRANVANCYRAMVDKGVMFVANDMIKRQLKTAFPTEDGSTHSAVPFMAGGMAGVLGMLVSYPLDLGRARLSVTLGNNPYAGVFTALKHVVKTEGIRGIFQGAGISVAAVIPYEGIKFGMYDVFSNLLREYRLNQPEPAIPQGSLMKAWVSGRDKTICGGLAATSAVMLTFPNDTIRRRMQMQGLNGAPYYRHSLHCYQSVIQKEGFRQLYRGIEVTLIRTVPNTAIQFATFHTLKQWLETQQDEQ